ncbi:BQ5605_C011g06444 [Microbotryum silenes-dioicae]|uniref:BQ5605_C011g06444 protein n=1 Tax=Microbotryum silenes-dioicae TaxID=796604 RepID=A0A2X0NLD0_9BASI|nr:BQ5605_C011g06444 [Microbotryum silenes-dioicae]
MSLEHEGSRSQMSQFRCNIAGCQRSFHHVRNLEAHLHVHERPRPLDRVLPTSSAAERSHLQVLRQQRSRQEFFRRRRRRQKNLRNGWPDCDVDGFNSSGSDYDDDSSSDSSSDSEYDHTLDDQPEWDARQKRKFRVEQPPLAGWACRADGQLCDKHTLPPAVPHAHLFDPNNVFYPFQDENNYRYALLTRSMSESLFNAMVTFNNSFLQVCSAEVVDAGTESYPSSKSRDITPQADRAFSNRLQLRSTIEKIPYAHHTEWREEKIIVTAEDLGWSNSDAELPFLQLEHTFRCRDAHHVHQHLLSIPVFCGHQHLRPMKVFEVKSNGQEQRVYGAPHTADKAWEMQDTLDDPTDVAVRIDTSSDSTVLSIGTGTASAHPVYMSLGVNTGFLKRENHGGLVVIAFLPKVERANKGNDEMFRIYKRKVLHRALEILWAPIRHLLSGRHLFQFADGHYRYIRVYFGPVSVDYLEACWLTSLVQGYVPCCVQEPLKLQEGPAAPRTSADAYEVRRAASQLRTITAQTKAAKEGGYHLGRANFARFPPQLLFTESVPS